jgi:enterochelin esterase-like enzyme
MSKWTLLLTENSISHEQWVPCPLFVSKNVSYIDYLCHMIKFWTQPIRTLTQLIKGHIPSIFEVRQWKSAALGRDMTIDVYLPPDYSRAKEKKYPVVIFNDGQDLPHMNMQKLLASLYKKRQIPYVIAVGVHAGDRMQEYGTALMPDYKGRGARAELYRQFVLNELFPWLHKRFRVDETPNQHVIAGFSLGGLSAFDIAYGAPQIFGAVGVFSGSFWWRRFPSPPDDPDRGRIMHDLVSNGPEWRHNQRYWMQVGMLDETDDRNNNGVIDSVDDTRDMIAVLKSKEVHERAIRYVEMPYGRHDKETWAEIMPDFLIWAFTSQESMD